MRFELAAVFDEDAIPDGKRFIADVIQRERQALSESVTVLPFHMLTMTALIDNCWRWASLKRYRLSFFWTGNPYLLSRCWLRPKSTDNIDLPASLSRLLQHEDVRQSLIEAAEACEPYIFTKIKNTYNKS